MDVLQSANQDQLAGRENNHAFVVREEGVGQVVDVRKVDMVQVDEMPGSRSVQRRLPKSKIIPDTEVQRR